MTSRTGMRLHHAWFHHSRCKVWQWTPLHSSYRKAKIWRYSIHLRRILPRRFLIRNTQTGCSGTLDESHQPKPETQDLPLVHDRRMFADPFRLCYNSVCAMQSKSVTMGFLGYGNLLGSMDPDLLFNSSRRWVSRGSVNITLTLKRFISCCRLVSCSLSSFYPL